MTDIADLGIRIDSSPATKAARELDALTVSAGRAEDAAQDLAATSRGRLAPGMAAGGHQSKMMAMQLSQVAQQASATGNWIQALAIQLPDMAMGFGAVGIAAGVLASVTLPLLASMFGSAGEGGKALEETLDTLSTTSEAYRASLDALQVSSDKMVETYGSMAAAARGLAVAQSEINAIMAADAMAATIDQITTGLLGMVEATADGEQNYRFLAEALGAADERGSILAATLGNLANAQGPEAQARAALALASAIERSSGGYANMNARAREVYNTALKIAEEASKTVGSTEAAAVAAGRLENGMAAAYAMYAASRNMASEMAAETERAAAAAFSLAQMTLAASSKTYSGRGGDPRTSNQEGYGEFKYNGPALDMFNNPIARGGGGGGGGGADPYADELQALVESLRAERDIEEEWYQESLTILQDRRAQEILGKQEHDAALVALHEEYQRRIAEIDANAAQQRITDTANLFGALASVAQAGGQKTAKLVATFQAIEGTVNAYGAAIKALNTPGLTLAGRFAAYASVLAAGLKGVAAIKQAGGVGGGGGGGLAAQGITSQAAGPAVEYRVHGIDRDAQYSGAFWEKVWNGLFEEGKRRGVTGPQMVFV